MQTQRVNAILVLCFIAFASSTSSAVDITINSLKTYQEIDGFGAAGDGDLNKAVNDLGMSVHREGISSDPPSVEGCLKTSGNLAKAAGFEMKRLITVFTPPSKYKIGPFQDGCVEWDPGLCGGTGDPAKFDQLANWYISILDAYKNAGYPLYALSLQNEPWLNMWYVSCSYSAQQYRALLKAVGPKIHAKYPDVKIVCAEYFLNGPDGATKYDSTYLSDPVGGPHCDIVARHGYTSTGSGVTFASSSMYSDMFKTAQIGKPRHIWMSEQSTYNESWDPADGIFKMACDIFQFLKAGNGSAWIWWLLQGSGGVGGSTEGMMNGSTPKKAYYCLKHYAKWVRPGAVRIESNDIGNVYSAAFAHTANKTLTVILINQGSTEQTVTIKGTDLPATFSWYLTTSTLDCAQQQSFASTVSIKLPPKSLSTVFGQGYSSVRTITPITPKRYVKLDYTAKRYDLYGRVLSNANTVSASGLQFTVANGKSIAFIQTTSNQHK